MPPKKGKKTKFSEVSQDWEWRDDEGSWFKYNEEDAAILEGRWQTDGDTAVFSTTDFSWNNEHQTVYKVAYDSMTQTNIETGVTRAIRRGGVGGKSPKKAKVNTVAKWMWEDDDGWEDFNDADSVMLEEEYLERGPKAVFKTSKFSFNKKFKTMYELNFAKMEQKNTKSKSVRSIQRNDPHGNVVAGGTPKKGSPLKGKKKGQQCQAEVPWEWFENETMKWKSYAGKDATMLESAHASGSKVFITKNLSFNKEDQTQYLFDFISMTQINNESGTSRKMKRKPSDDDDDEDEDDDGGYASVMMSVAKKGKDKASSDDLAPKFEPSLTAAVSKKQRGLGAQSLRGKVKRDYGPSVSTDEHATECFDEMLDREAEFAGEWAVFYHSYSVAALLYEVQAAVACVLFRFKSEFASLPRLMHEPFEHIPDADRMLEEFPTWSDRDHNPAFRKVGLCGVVGLLADDDEAPPTSCFLAGYSVGPLTGLLDALLEKCGVPKKKVKALAQDIVKLAVKHGLDCGAYGGKACKSGRSGHYLQIFMRREIVDKYTYASHAYGVPDEKRQPMGEYLEKNKALKGQVRITANPDVFLQAACVRMFLYSADPSFHEKRKAFQSKLVGVLSPLLGGEKERIKAATGIFGGAPPEWWSSEAQEEESKMSASRYGSCA